MEIVKCTEVRKKFKIADDYFEILKGVNLSINEGEFVSIIGESGSGKSTLLNILGGLMPVDNGEILILNERVDELSENELALFRKEHIGFIFQSYNLLPQLTTIENVEMPLIFSGVPKAKRRTIAMEMIERVGLIDRINNKPSELSGGQQQRVSIARALINNPKLILADEPTGNLDSKTSIEILDLLKELNDTYNMTFIVVTHSQIVNEYANRVIKMKDGLIY
ncbi:ABC transporter ATP-binding protein [Clostridium ihumii]|uniref:ABC transporter ATP-binding protein n=1 Tax=Clostridium ihumii TaxID=1470356 RepID=UPI000558956D|nr:ABC transporter ATP-binding protein [Clostridium ihumii]